jgi:hypothetical protein
MEAMGYQAINKQVIGDGDVDDQETIDRRWG